MNNGNGALAGIRTRAGSVLRLRGINPRAVAGIHHSPLVRTSEVDAL